MGMLHGMVSATLGNGPSKHESNFLILERPTLIRTHIEAVYDDVAVTYVSAHSNFLIL